MDPHLPLPWPLDAGRDSEGLETARGKRDLADTKRKALTEEVFVEATMLQAPDSFDRLLKVHSWLFGKPPLFLFFPLFPSSFPSWGCAFVYDIVS